MPKIYSDEEKKEIIERLYKAGEQGIMHYGVKKTTVDYLVKEAGIPKGTFYLFYESKELLLFEILMQVHEEMEQDFFREVANAGNAMDLETLTDIFMRMFEKCEQSCILRMITSDDMQILAAKLPKEILSAHMDTDTDNVQNLKAFFPDMDENKAQIVAGALRGLFLLLVQKKQMGEEYFYGSMRMLVRGVLMQLF